jgi:hypothetical protein
MILLSRMERDLLNFLCCCANKGVAITELAEARSEMLERLRQAQLVQADSFEPFPWALETWRIENKNEATAPKREPEGPASPASVGSESAALCSDASAEHAAGIVEAALSSLEPAPEMLPHSASAHDGDALALELERFCQANGIAPTRFGKICCSGRGSILRILRRNQPTDYLVAQIRAGLDNPPAELFAPRKARRQLATSYDAEKIRRSAARRADAVRKGAIAKAMHRIEQGLGPADVRGGGVHIRIAQIAIESRLKEEARLADPVEQAKTILRRRYAPVVSAEIVNGPAGMFVVGRKTVSKSEMLEMAERCVPA